jgi:hypothetical protein
MRWLEEGEDEAEGEDGEGMNEGEGDGRFYRSVNTRVTRVKNSGYVTVWVGFD